MLTRSLASRPCRLLLLAVVIGPFNLCLAGGQAAAQDTLSRFFPASSQPTTGQQRDEEYDRLAEDYAELQQSNLLRRVVRLVAPTVVHIEATHNSAAVYGSRGRTEEAGSGVLIEMGGATYVMTNRHVIKESRLQDIKIVLRDGRVFHPTLVRDDSETDVAVMQIEAEGVVTARLGNSDEMEIGDFVVAIGSPFGEDLSGSVTYGIISGKGRHDLTLGGDEIGFQDFVQTDAAINPGNSGGPLINLKGEVVGINTAIASASGGNEGIGLSIPVNMAKTIAQRLVERGRVERAFLGVNLDRGFGPTDAARLGMPAIRGARISGIIPESPAAESDLEVDDVILEFDGVPILNDNHLVNLVSLTEIGREVSVLFFRNAEIVQSTVTVGRRRN